MKKFLALLFWAFIAVFSVVQLASPIFSDSPTATMRMSMSDTIDVADMGAHCAQQNHASDTTSHCADTLCMAACASHCMGVVPLTVVATSGPIIQNRFEPTPTFKPESSAIQPSTPPPKSA
jgi:hypothetical protein